MDQPVNPLGGTMVADPGAFNPYGQPPQGGFGSPPGGYGAPPAPGGYGSPDPAAGGAPPGGGYGGPPPGGFGGPAPGGYGSPPGGGYGAPQPAPMGGGFGPPGAMVPMGGGARGPVGKTRNIGLVILFLVLSCGIYGLFAMYNMMNELKQFRGKDDFSPATVLVVALFVSSISLLIFGIPDKVTEAKQLAGIPNGKSAHPVLYFFFGFIFLAVDLNEVWAAAGGNQPR